MNQQASAPSDSRGFAAGYLCLLLTFTLWGSLYVVSKFVLGRLPAFTISFLRFLLAFGFLTLADKWRPRPAQTAPRSSQRLARRHIPYILCIGFAGYFLAVGAQLLGTRYAGASMASLLNSMNPVTMTIFGAWILKEKLTVPKVLGILLAIFGVFLILGGGAKNAGLAGILLSLFSVLVWSFVSVLARKVTSQYDSLYITRLACGVAVLCYLPAAAAEAFGAGVSVLAPLSEPSCLFSLLYTGILCTGTAYLLWNHALSLLDAGTCSAFYPVQPMVSTGLGVLLLGEQLTAKFLLGAAFIIGGVLLSLRKRGN